MLGKCSRPHSKHRGMERSEQVGCVAGQPWGGQGVRASRVLPHESLVNLACCLLPAISERWKRCREGTRGD